MKNGPKLWPGCYLLPLAMALASCGEEPTEQAGEEPTEQVESSSAPIVGTPNGLTCGIAYFTNSGVVDDACQLRSTATAVSMPGNPSLRAPGFQLDHDGDYGMSAGRGFWHQSRTVSTSGVTNAVSDQMELPKGTACGFKHSCNGSRSNTCFGLDPVRQCPGGWLRKWAGDTGAPGGCGFFWCEYQDPHNLCSSLDCRVNNVMDGLACGISGTSGNGQCLGLTPTPLTQCPQGYSRRGFFDAGAAPQSGLGWCARGT